MPASSVLSDIKIADMTSTLFGPYCTQTLADMGAQVVKLEPSYGDVMRYGGKPAKSKTMGPMHMTINRGKRSVDWDQKSDLGKEATRRLIANSDVFIHNIRQSAIERLNLTFEEVKEINPEIVYVHLTGFDSRGPYAGRPAFDDIVQGLSGMTGLMGRLQNTDQQTCLPMMLVDKVAALHAVYGVLGALHARNKMQEAQFVEVPMFETVTHFLLEDHFDGAVFDPPSDDFGFKRCFDETLQPMKTLDGWIIIAPYTDKRWQKAFEVVGASKELEDERLNDKKKRFFNSAYKHERLASYFTKLKTDQLIHDLNEAGIPASHINNLEDLTSEPQLQATDFFQKREHPTEGMYWEMRPPVHFKDSNETEIRPAPHIGEHTEEVLRELNLNLDKV